MGGEVDRAVVEAARREQAGRTACFILRGEV